MDVGPWRSTCGARASSASWSPASRAAVSRRCRARLEEGWGARVTEAMGIGDIGDLALGRVRGAGRYAPRRARVRPPRADRSPDSGVAPSRSSTGRPANSCSHIAAPSAAPLLRFRTRGATSELRTTPCPCGRPGPRIRCIGRTDDMLIVRGSQHIPLSGPRGRRRLRPARERPHPRPAASPQASSRSRPSPSPSSSPTGVELDNDLAEAIRERLRSVLVIPDTRSSSYPGAA